MFQDRSVISQMTIHFVLIVILKVNSPYKHFLMQTAKTPIVIYTSKIHNFGVNHIAKLSVIN
jgi:hypothetical protein